MKEEWHEEGNTAYTWDHVTPTHTSPPTQLTHTYTLLPRTHTHTLAEMKQELERDKGGPGRNDADFRIRKAQVCASTRPPSYICNASICLSISGVASPCRLIWA